jgi:hypothetical protein
MDSRTTRRGCNRPLTPFRKRRTKAYGSFQQGGTGSPRRSTSGLANIKLQVGGSESGGERGIRTLDTGVSPYNGLANRRLQPLGHLSVLQNLFTCHAQRTCYRRSPGVTPAASRRQPSRLPLLHIGCIEWSTEEAPQPQFCPAIANMARSALPVTAFPRQKLSRNCSRMADGPAPRLHQHVAADNFACRGVIVIFPGLQHRAERRYATCMYVEYCWSSIAT